jgi:myo-inositol-1-phosphate synthase
MKSPPVQFTDAEAHARTLRFAAGEAEEPATR